MTTIAEAAKASREKRERREAAERAAKAAAEAEKEKEKEDEPGFFSSFFGRGETIDEAVEGAQRSRQSTDDSQ